MSFVTFTAAVVKTDRLGIGYRGERVGVGVGGGHWGTRGTAGATAPTNAG